MTTVGPWMTLVEFMHPLRNASRGERVQAVLLYGKHHEQREEMSVAEIRAALARSRVRASGWNLSQVLAASSPNVDAGRARGRWKITDTGERHLLEDLGVTVPSAVRTVGVEVAPLESLTSRVEDDATRDYIEEAIRCLTVGARRAGVVFLWSGAVSAIRDTVWTHGAPAIEAALSSHHPRARFNKRNDFAGVKEASLLQIAQDLAVYDKSERKRLGEALDLRNDCGHPGKYRPGEKKVASFIEDIVGIVWP